MFEVGKASLHYNITVTVLKFTGVVKNSSAAGDAIKPNWKQVSQFKLSPSNTLGRSTNGKVSNKT